MKKIFGLVLMLFAMASNAQVTNASLEASGLTCSLCSKAVKTGLESVPFVAKVQVDIKSQQYKLTFKEGSDIDFDKISKAVQDAGFSVASLKATAIMPSLKLQKDEHVKIGSQYLHFLNAANQSINGAVDFLIVDKGFVPAKEAKKWAAASKMPCVQTGRMASCCSDKGEASARRIFHVII